MTWCRLPAALRSQYYGAERLERGGYVSTTYQPAQGRRIGGVSTVVLFDAGAGARDWMAYETSEDALRAQMRALGRRLGRSPDLFDGDSHVYNVDKPLATGS